MHGENALFVARNFYRTTAVVKYLGPAGSGGLPSVAFNRSLFDQVGYSRRALAAVDELQLECLVETLLACACLEPTRLVDVDVAIQDVVCACYIKLVLIGSSDFPFHMDMAVQAVVKALLSGMLQQSH